MVEADRGQSGLGNRQGSSFPTKDATPTGPACAPVEAFSNLVTALTIRGRSLRRPVGHPPWQVVEDHLEELARGEDVLPRQRSRPGRAAGDDRVADRAVLHQVPLVEPIDL